MSNENQYLHLNNSVKVKLTEHGKKQYLEYYEGIKALLTNGEAEIRLDEDGYTTFMLWELMAIFGPKMVLGTNELPFEDSQIVLVR